MPSIPGATCSCSRCACSRPPPSSDCSSPARPRLLIAGVLAQEGRVSLAAVHRRRRRRRHPRRHPRLRDRASPRAPTALVVVRPEGRRAPMGRAHEYVHRRGGLAIFFGRWIGVLRAVVPAIAGDAANALPGTSCCGTFSARSSRCRPSSSSAMWRARRTRRSRRASAKRRTCCSRWSRERSSPDVVMTKRRERQAEAVSASVIRERHHVEIQFATRQPISSSAPATAMIPMTAMHTTSRGRSSEKYVRVDRSTTTR